MSQPTNRRITQITFGMHKCSQTQMPTICLKTRHKHKISPMLITLLTSILSNSQHCICSVDDSIQLLNFCRTSCVSYPGAHTQQEKGQSRMGESLAGDVGRIAGGNHLSLGEFFEVKELDKTEWLSKLCKKLTCL